MSQWSLFVAVSARTIWPFAVLRECFSSAEAHLPYRCIAIQIVSMTCARDEWLIVCMPAGYANFIIRLLQEGLDIQTCRKLTKVREHHNSNSPRCSNLTAEIHKGTQTSQLKFTQMRESHNSNSQRCSKLTTETRKFIRISRQKLTNLFESHNKNLQSCSNITTKTHQIARISQQKLTKVREYPNCRTQRCSKLTTEIRKFIRIWKLRFSKGTRTS